MGFFDNVKDGFTAPTSREGMVARGQANCIVRYVGGDSWYKKNLAGKPDKAKGRIKALFRLVYIDGDLKVNADHNNRAGWRQGRVGDTVTSLWQADAKLADKDLNRIIMAAVAAGAVTPDASGSGLAGTEEEIEAALSAFFSATSDHNGYFMALSISTSDKKKKDESEADYRARRAADPEGGFTSLTPAPLDDDTFQAIGSLIIENADKFQNVPKAFGSTSELATWLCAMSRSEEKALAELISSALSPS